MSATYRHRASSPVELLVVVCVVALASALLVQMLGAVPSSRAHGLCLRNLRAQGLAQAMYTADHDGWIPSGIMSNDAPEPGVDNPFYEWGATHWALLPYLGYTGAFGHVNSLWSRPNRLAHAYDSIPEYQCARHPDPNSELDYLSNAMPIPFERRNLIRSDWEPGGEACAGFPVGGAWYYGLRREEELTAAVDPADYVYIAEAHACLSASPAPNNFRFNAVVLGSHLPFAANPRIADDPRHPFGLVNLFFDGHAAALRPEELDPGFPAPPAERLRWFSPCDALAECFDTPLQVEAPHSPQRSGFGR